MRTAILSDLHGNAIALAAVLADVERQGGADEYWVLGDLASSGPDPAGVVRRVADLPNLRVIRGNNERYLLGEEPPILAHAERVSGLTARKMMEIASSFAWARGVVTGAGLLPWIAALPATFRTVLPGGERLLAVHASLNSDDGDGFHPKLTDQQLTGMVAGAEADLIVCGHTHLPLKRRVNGVLVVNVGSVGLPVTADRRACYALLKADQHGCEIVHQHVAYDWDSAIAAIRASGYPDKEFLERAIRGDMRHHNAIDPAASGNA
ncbi:MAG: metallophosphoesterase family protein [Chloroflexota bacterium]